MSFVRLRASTGAISVGRRVASYAWGSWNVTLPDDAQVDESLQEYGVSPGYVSRLHDDEDEGLFDRLFVRADAQIDLKAKITTVDKVLKAAEKRTEGDVYFERDITGEDLGMYVPGVDYEVGDTVDVLVYGKLLELPVTAITSTGSTSEHQHYTVHVGGNMVSDAEALAEKTSEVERAIAEDRKKLAQSNEKIIKSVNTAQSTADTARSEAGTAQSTADTARSEAKTADNKAVAAQTKANSVGTDLNRYKTTTDSSITKLQKETQDLYSTTVDLQTFNDAKGVLEGSIKNAEILSKTNLDELRADIEGEYTKQDLFLESQKKWQETTQGRITLALSENALNASNGVAPVNQQWVNENQAALNALQFDYQAKNDVFVADTRKLVENIQDQIEFLKTTDEALKEKDIELEKQQNSMNREIYRIDKTLMSIQGAIVSEGSKGVPIEKTYISNADWLTLGEIKGVPLTDSPFYYSWKVNLGARHSNNKRVYLIEIKYHEDQAVESALKYTFGTGAILIPRLNETDYVDKYRLQPYRNSGFCDITIYMKLTNYRSSTGSQRSINGGEFTVSWNG